MIFRLKAISWNLGFWMAQQRNSTTTVLLFMLHSSCCVLNIWPFRPRACKTGRPAPRCTCGSQAGCRETRRSADKVRRIKRWAPHCSPKKGVIKGINFCQLFSGWTKLVLQTLQQLRTQLVQAYEHSALPDQDLLEYIGRFQADVAKAFLQSWCVHTTHCCIYGLQVEDSFLHSDVNKYTSVFFHDQHLYWRAFRVSPTASL